MSAFNTRDELETVVRMLGRPGIAPDEATELLLQRELLLARLAAQQSTEGSEEPEAADRPLEAAGDIARRWADDIKNHPLTDDQALELAKVYAMLSVSEGIDRALKAIHGV